LVRRCAGILQERDHGRDPQARACADTRAVCRGPGSRGRWGALRGEDRAPHRQTAPAAGRGRNAGCRDCQESEGAWVWWVTVLLQQGLCTCPTYWESYRRIGPGGDLTMRARESSIALTQPHSLSTRVP